MTLTSTFRKGKVKSSYANRKSICEFICDGIGMISLSVNISGMFSVEICMTLTFAIKMRQGQM